MRTTSIFLALLFATPLAAQRLISVDSSRTVWQHDITNGSRVQLGTVSSNVSTAGGFAYDRATGRLFVTSTSNDSVYRVDLTNWSATLIGPYGNASLVMHGLEWDSSTNTLYGMSSHDGGLYTIDQATGAATLVGLSGVTSFCNLAYDSTLDQMWMTNSGSDSFYSINRATGVATLVGPLTGPTNPNGLAYNSDNQTIYIVCNHTDTLYTVNTATGAATVVGAYGSSNLLGLVYLPGTGRLTRTVHGCGATTIVVTGQPEIGFTVTTTVGNTNGIPAIGFGLTPIGFAFCGTCTVGHEWTLALPGPTAPLTIPPNPAFIGFDLYIQGADILGTGGCPDPMLTATDTIKVAIG